VRARLLQHARASEQDYNRLLVRYAIERWLYRLSVSPYASQFLLKGALLFDLWFDEPHRPTRDADLLGFGSAELPEVERRIAEICRIEYPDGMQFDPVSIRVEAIRREANYSGARATVIGTLAGARCSVQIDIGFGDAVTPTPEQAAYPVILDDFAAPILRVYPRYTVVAEKVHALALLGMANSRMKDYFDLWYLAQRTEFDLGILATALRSTFERRAAPWPAALPIGLTDEFGVDARKREQWQAFIQRNQLDAPDLREAVRQVRTLVAPALSADRAVSAGLDRWPPGGPWEPK
jgi:hypothetical protein